MKRSPRVYGEIVVPGDKSISHRAVLFASLSEGISRVRGFLDAEDTARTIVMMKSLGVKIERVSKEELRIEGRGLRGFSEPEDVIDAGNSGTTIRIGAGLLAAQPFFTVITGDSYLRRRPMARVILPLSQMGASIQGRNGDRFPPLCIRGKALKSIRYAMPVASAQVKSAILLAGLYADSPVTVVEPLPTRDHTERMLGAIGAAVSGEGTEITVNPASRLLPIDQIVPGDISSAAFFLALAAVMDGSELVLRGVGVNPRRTGVVEVLRRMGAEILFENERVESGEPVADIVVRGKDLAATNIFPEEVPALIDEIPVLCVAAAFASGRTEIRGAGELRVKESDRIGAMVANLTALGISCGEYEDGLWVEGPSSFPDRAVCRSMGDHRIAMSMLVLQKAAGTELTLDDTACIDTSFPDFRSMIASL
ncbi:MAG: 3-phosphoshikimate 1-carboxyvinyltransferase [Syntrophorhabdaceae bacterium]|nr:3-phosphoshikimate 1-carboxyvinyltransferase [Syntrophorhabdaceae bacterium]